MSYLPTTIEVLAALVVLARTLQVLDRMSWRSLKARPLLVVSWIVLGCGALLAIAAPFLGPQLPDFADVVLTVGLAGWLLTDRRRGALQGNSPRAPR
jgi:hypothetical protein